MTVNWFRKNESKTSKKDSNYFKEKTVSESDFNSSESGFDTRLDGDGASDGLSLRRSVKDKKFFNVPKRAAL